MYKRMCVPHCQPSIIIAYPGTIGCSRVMVITSDQDNTVAYGGTNTMRRHIYTNKALTPPPSCNDYLSNDGPFGTRRMQNSSLKKDKQKEPTVAGKRGEKIQVMQDHFFF